MPTSRHEHAIVVLNYKLILIALHANSAIRVFGINVLECRTSHCTKIIILVELAHMMQSIWQKAFYSGVGRSFLSVLDFFVLLHVFSEIAQSMQFHAGIHGKAMFVSPLLFGSIIFSFCKYAVNIFVLIFF